MKLKMKYYTYQYMSQYYRVYISFLQPLFRWALPNICSFQPPVTYHTDPWRLEVECSEWMLAKEEVSGEQQKKICENYYSKNKIYLLLLCLMYLTCFFSIHLSLQGKQQKSEFQLTTSTNLIIKYIYTNFIGGGPETC